MSCNISIPLQRIIDDVADTLAGSYISVDNPFLNESVLTDTTFRGDITMDTEARDALCTLIQTCAITAAELKWLDRPEGEGLIAVSSGAEADSAIVWVDLGDLITAQVDGKITAAELEWLAQPTGANLVAISSLDGSEVVTTWKDIVGVITTVLEENPVAIAAGDVIVSDGVSQEDLNSDFSSDIESQKLDTGITATAKFDGVARTQAEKNSDTFNLKDFGSVGDGVADEEWAFRKAFAAISSVGGGTLVIPAGRYYTTTTLLLPSDINIEMFGATLVKHNGTVLAGSYSFFATRHASGEGYGSGHSRITFRGGTVLGGHYLDMGDISLLTAHHSDDILISEMTFDNIPLKGHSLDLAGCRRVTIRDCTFKGFNRPFDHPIGDIGNTECIQIDTSQDGAIAFPQDPNAVFDGLGCEDILIENCKFLPKVIDGILYPCPNPFGNHSVVENLPHKNITFRGNLVDTPNNVYNVSSKSSQPIHINGVDNLIIENNVFTTREPTNNIGWLLAIHNGKYASVRNPDGTFVEGGKAQAITTALSPRGVSICNNKFINFQGRGTDKSCRIIRIHAYPERSTNSGVIANNEFINCLSDANSTNSTLIELSTTDGFSVHSNRVTNAHRFLYLLDVRNTQVNGNLVNKITKNSMIIRDSTNLSIMNNTINSTDDLGTSTPIDIFSSKDVFALNNVLTIEKKNSIARGIAFSQASTGVVGGNTTVNYTLVANINADSTATVYNNTELQKVV